MDSPSATRDGAARALLRRESRALRAAGAAADPAGPRRPGGGDRRRLAGGAAARHAARASRGAGWPELAAAAALALLGAGLALAQERAQLAAGEAAAGPAARRRLRPAARGRPGRPDRRRRARLAGGGPGRGAGRLFRPLDAGGGPGDGRAGAGRWPPSPGPISAAAWCWRSPGVLYPVAMALTGIGAAQASRRQFEALGRLSGRFLDRMRGLPTLVLFNRQEAEAVALGEAATELRAPHHEGAAGRLPLGHGAGAALGRRPGLPGLAAPGAARRRRRPDRGAVQPAAGAGLLRPAARLRRGLPGPALGRRRRRRAGAAAGGRPGARACCWRRCRRASSSPSAMSGCPTTRPGRRRSMACPSGRVPGRRWCWPGLRAPASPRCCGS